MMVVAAKKFCMFSEEGDWKIGHLVTRLAEEPKVSARVQRMVVGLDVMARNGFGEATDTAVRERIFTVLGELIGEEASELTYRVWLAEAHLYRKEPVPSAPVND